MLLLACSRGESRAPAGAVVAGEPSDTSVTAVVGPEGASVEIEGVVTLLFPVDAFDTSREVTLSVTDAPSSEEERTRWDVSSGPPPPMPHDIRIHFGPEAPATAFEVVVAVPNTYLRAVPDDRRPHLFARVVSGGDMEDLDLYEPVVESSFDAQDQVVRATVPASAVRPAGADGVVSAILLVGTLER